MEDAVGNCGDAADLFHAETVNSIREDSKPTGADFPNTATYQNGIIRGSGVSISEIGASSVKMRAVVNVTPNPVLS